MRQVSLKIRPLFLILPVLFLVTAAAQASPVTLTISKSSGGRIPDDFIGLSFETSVVSPNPNKIRGRKPFYFFSPTNAPLIRFFNVIGVKNLRVGGGTVDMQNRPVPGPADIDQLFAFAGKAGIRVIYSFRLLRGDPEQAASLARYIWRHDRAQLDAFAIGNEPDWPAYHHVDPRITNYPSYLADWRRFAAAIHAAAPGARFAGPDTGSDYPVARAKNTDFEGKSWTELFARDEKSSGLIAVILQHDYVGQSAKGVSAPEAIQAMLSRQWPTAEYPALYEHVLARVAADGLPCRMTECNDYTGGVNHASNAFVSALWALDYMHWWAAHGCAGVNFHNNEWIYTDTIFLDAAGNCRINPKAYGLKAFDLGSHGDVTPVAISNPGNLNLTGYAVRGDHGLFVTIINKEYDRDARIAAVTIEPNSPWKTARVMFLAGQPGSATGVTLGGSEINMEGSWNGKWMPLATDKTGKCALNVPPASAAIVRLSD